MKFLWLREIPRRGESQDSQRESCESCKPWRGWCYGRKLRSRHVTQRGFRERLRQEKTLKVLDFNEFLWKFTWLKCREDATKDTEGKYAKWTLLEEVVNTVNPLGGNKCHGNWFHALQRIRIPGVNRKRSEERRHFRVTDITRDIERLGIFINGNNSPHSRTRESETFYSETQTENLRQRTVYYHQRDSTSPEFSTRLEIMASSFFIPTWIMDHPTHPIPIRIPFSHLHTFREIRGGFCSWVVVKVVQGFYWLELRYLFNQFTPFIISQQHHRDFTWPRTSSSWNVADKPVGRSKGNRVFKAILVF